MTSSSLHPLNHKTKRRPRPNTAFHLSKPIFPSSKNLTQPFLTPRKPPVILWHACKNNTNLSNPIPTSSTIQSNPSSFHPSTLNTTNLTVSLPTPLGLSLTETRLHDLHNQVIVTRVHPNSPANGQIRPGDIITSPSGNLDTVVSYIRSAKQIVTLQLQRTVPVSSENNFNHNALADAPKEAGQARLLSVNPGDDIYEHQNSAITNLLAVYATARKLGSGEHARLQLLKVAGKIVKSRACSNSRSVQMISDIVYRLRRFGVPLDSRFYNIVMSSLIQAGDPVRARELFQEIVDPNVECYTTLVKAYSMLKRPDDAMALLPTMRQNGVTPNIRTYNALIASCVRVGRLEKAQQLFTEMLVDKIKPNAVSWNIIINWHVKQNVGGKRLKNVLQAFRDMKASGVVPNIVTFTTIMKAYTASGALNKAEEVFTEMKQRLPHHVDAEVYNTLIKGYSLRLEWRRCLQLLSEMNMNKTVTGGSFGERFSRSPFASNEKVPAHSRNFSRKRPWLDDEDIEQSDVLNEKKHGNTTKVLSPVLNDDESKCKPNEVTYSLVIRATANAGRPYLTREIFDEMIQRGIFPPPAPAVVSLMTAYARAGMLSDSFNVLKSLKSWGVFPDMRMMTSLMHGCLVANQPQLALSVYAKFKNSRLNGDIITHTNLLKAYGMLGEHDKAFNILKGLRKQSSRIKPNIVMYNTLIECVLMHDRTDLALKALDLLLGAKNPKIRMNRQTFQALTQPIKTFIEESTSNWDNDTQQTDFGSVNSETLLQYLMDVLRRVREGNAVPNGDLYHCLLHICDRCDEWYLGSILVTERQNGGFLLSQKDQRNVRQLEDYFRAQGIKANLGNLNES